MSFITNPWPPLEEVGSLEMGGEGFIFLVTPQTLVGTMFSTKSWDNLDGGQMARLFPEEIQVPLLTSLGHAPIW